MHPAIYSNCRTLYEDGAYAEAVEKSFKVVRDRLRALTSHETGSEAFAKGKLYIDGAAAPHGDEDFQNGVKFLTMAIDRFRNERVTPRMETSAIHSVRTSTCVSVASPCISSKERKAVPPRGVCEVRPDPESF